ncbi:EF-hand domain-containing protein [Amycolatopsis sp. NPDC089917]|uniref:EF-hand domain-containing protein n=1 Tax=Amycolatopsis sp. NPDC089917 TaxID=3155187 RepID=UPI0034337901
MTTVMRNERELQRFRKWDTNGDGVIDRGDYQSEARRIVSAFGESVDSGRGRAVWDALMDLFERQAEAVGVDPDEALSEEQYLAANRELMFSRGDAGFDELLRPTIAAIADLCDSDRDGLVSKVELRSWLGSAVGLSDADSDAAFDRIDLDGDGSLTVDELVTAVREFHYGRLDIPLLG